MKMTAILGFVRRLGGLGMALNLPPVLSSLPPGTRALTAMLVGFSSLLFLLKLSSNPSDYKAILGASKDSTLAFSYLVLVPGKVLYFPWTVLTAPFVEANLIEVSCCFPTIV